MWNCSTIFIVEKYSLVERLWYRRKGFAYAASFMGNFREEFPMAFYKSPDMKERFPIQLERLFAKAFEQYKLLKLKK